VDDAHGTVTYEDDRHAIRGADGEHTARLPGERSIGIDTCMLAGRGDLDHGDAVDLPQPGRTGRQARDVGEIAVGAGGETDPVDDAVT
jgi:hypothetical protein